MKRLIVTIMAGILLLACTTLHAQRVLYIGDSVTDGGWGRSGGRRVAVRALTFAKSF